MTQYKTAEGTMYPSNLHVDSNREKIVPASRGLIEIARMVLKFTVNKNYPNTYYTVSDDQTFIAEPAR